MIGIILGKEVKKYIKDGEQKVARNLHVMWEQKRAVDGLVGNKVEAVFVNFEIPAGVEVGVKCDFEYEIQPTKNGSMARLVDITPITKMRVNIVPDIAEQ